MKTLSRRIALLSAVLLAGSAYGAERFVSPRGDDKADGLSLATAQRTVGKGAAALKAGDTLTILPGEYFESLSLKISGEKDAPITIRAQRPGTVLLRGDADLGAFEPAPGLRYTWSTPFDREVEGVGERDTGKMYAFVPSPEETQDTRASCFYDSAAKRLYVHTSDSLPPDRHALVACLTNGFGMLFTTASGQKTVHDIVVDGLAFSGYVTRDIATLPGGNTRWGLYFVEAERCVIRRCTAFLNGGGIAFVRPRDCLIEDCVGFGNFSTYSSSGGNIISWTPASNTIMRRNLVHSTISNGIRFYGDGAKDCLLESNIAYDCGYGEIWIKGGDNTTSRIERNVSLGPIHNVGSSKPDNARWNLCEYASDLAEDGSNIFLNKMRRLDRNANFASPDHYDFRLQSDSELRGKGPGGADPGPFPYKDEVFFVSPQGDDSAKGTSVKQAWKTLARACREAGPGRTVYVMPGKYAEALAPARSGEEGKPIVFRGRGRDVTIAPPAGKGEALVLAGLSHVRVEDMELGDVDAKRSTACRLERLSVRSLVSAEGSSGLSVRNCALASAVLRDAKMAEVSGCVFVAAAKPGAVPFDLDAASLAELWSDRNAFAQAGPLARVGGAEHKDLAAWRKATGLDERSLASPVGGLPALAGRGPLASAIGPGQPRKVQAPARIENLAVLSVTATTANIEWWTPNAEATTTLEWGLTEKCENKIENIFDGEVFHTASLTGLKPGTKYYYRVSATTPVWEFHSNEELAELERVKTRQVQRTEVASLTTLAADSPARTFHVSLKGDDGRDGLSPATAWKTLRHAAAAVVAGDTVLVHGGKYEENVPVRATGDKERPVTFRAAPNEKVWMEGSGQKRNQAFRVAFKSHVILDGFYFRDFRSKPYNSASEGGAVCVISGSDITVRRCFYDGRARTYMPYFILASDTSRFLMENCVVVMGWNNISIWRSPDLTLRNNVFYNGQIRALCLYNMENQPVTLSHNLICDNIPQKFGNPLVMVGHMGGYRSDNNCYFSRGTDKTRKVAHFVRDKTGEVVRKEALLAEVQQLTGQDKNSFFANPGIPLVKEMKLKYDDPKEYETLELRREGGREHPLPMDFEDFFADPKGPCGKASDGKPIGLDPAAFARQ